jgi:hypothetical protein
MAAPEGIGKPPGLFGGIERLQAEHGPQKSAG